MCAFNLMMLGFVYAAVTCQDPGAAPFSLRFGTNFSFPHSLTYQCLSGYNLIGSPRLQCLENSSWSAPLPTCQPVNCPKLLSPPYSQQNTSNHSFGSVVEFRCLSGFSLHGVRSLSCQANKLWTGHPPSCIPVHCSQLQAEPHSRIVFQNTSFLGKVLAVCETGYVRSRGSVSRFCQADQAWSGSALQCKGNVLPWPKKRTIIEIRGEKNAVPRVISCSIRRDQRRASPIRDCPRLLPCANRT